jgi:lysophospholipase
VRLRAVLWPRAGARGTVLIFPGRTEHAEKYGRTAADLAARGFAAAAVDWRGQGLADRLMADPRAGHVRRFSDYQRDVDAFLALAAAEGLPQPWHLIAHSMGGAIGLRALSRDLPLQSALFSAPMWGLLTPMGANRLVGAIAQGAGAIGLRERYAPAPATGAECYLLTARPDDNVLTRDPESLRWMQAHLRAEPRLVLAGPTLGWLAAALAECRALKRLPCPAARVLVVYGTQELVVDVPAIRERLVACPAWTGIAVEGARHEVLMEAPSVRAAVLNRATALFAPYG